MELWSPVCLHEIKARIHGSVALAIPVEHEQVDLFTDTSTNGLGAMLSQGVKEITELSNCWNKIQKIDDLMLGHIWNIRNCKRKQI